MTAADCFQGCINSIQWRTEYEVGDAIFNRKPAKNPRPQPTRIVSRKRSDGATVATSVCITPAEKSVLLALMAKTHKSGSVLLREGLQKVLAEDREVVPPSIGIVNGVYPATIEDRCGRSAKRGGRAGLRRGPS